MKYINIIKITVQGILLSFVLSACTDWLQVDPKDRILEDQVFSSEITIQEDLNGIYLNMAHNDSYGSELTGKTIGLVAQEYYVPPRAENGNPEKFYLAKYNYTERRARARIDAIWYKNYNIILGINTFISRLRATENTSVIAPSRRDILLGEAYGLRAYIHLDLLRLFGPVYAVDSTLLAIPYRDEAKIEYRPRMTATEVMDKIMADINTSSALLEDDPVRTEGTMSTLVEDSLTSEQRAIDPFYRKRSHRMNYYAVQALKVRALMYRGNKPAAASIAKSLVNSAQFTEKFPWIKNADIFERERENRIFSPEVIFGIYSYNMYANYTSYYSSGITDAVSVYATASKNINVYYDVIGGELSLAPDVRSKFWIEWRSPTGVEEQLMASLKFMRSVSTTEATYLQPLIRKSELYYAIAEAERDIAYLDEVRLNRGLKTVAEQKPVYELDTEITNEYIREFRDEGQLFFYYKRMFMPSILNGVPSSTGPSPLSMTKGNYVFPIPQAELDY